MKTNQRAVHMRTHLPGQRDGASSETETTPRHRLGCVVARLGSGLQPPPAPPATASPQATKQSRATAATSSPALPCPALLAPPPLPRSSAAASHQKEETRRAAPHRVAQRRVRGLYDWGGCRGRPAPRCCSCSCYLEAPHRRAGIGSDRIVSIYRRNETNPIQSFHRPTNRSRSRRAP